MYVSTLVLLIKFACVNSRGFNLFLIGDSFDRIWTSEWGDDKITTYHNYSESANYIYPHYIVWGDKILDQYHNSPIFTRDSGLNDTVTQVQIFGSNMTGPYNDERTSRSDNTFDRVNVSLHNYFELIGKIFRQV
jgi:hypothetical protein